MFDQQIYSELTLPLLKQGTVYRHPMVGYLVVHFQFPVTLEPSIDARVDENAELIIHNSFISLFLAHFHL